MDSRLAHTITLFIAGVGVVITLGLFALSGVDAAMAAAVGATVGVANWLAIRWLGGRIIRGRARAAASVLLALKMGALIALCWVLMARLGLDPMGFILGLGSFVVGIVLGSTQVGRHLAEPSEGVG